MIDAIRQEGGNPYPERFERTHTLREATLLEEGTSDVRICGRLVSLRKMGKLAFGHLQDVLGRMQICMSVDHLGPEPFKEFLQRIDIGDFLGVSGDVFRTRTGEITVAVKAYQLLGKALRPLPEKWHGLQDIELCQRKRYLDLIMSEETQQRFLLRSRIISEIRAFLEHHSFIEVDTPVLTNKHGGANARPFVTHHNALDIDVYLRIAPETYLKRLIVGGFDRVYEFARCFRNEGSSPGHIQDFTMLEFYAAYWNFRDNLNFTRLLILNVLEKTLGKTQITFKGEIINFGELWRVVSYTDLLKECSGIDIAEHPTKESLLKVAEEAGIEFEDIDTQKAGRGTLIDSLYKKTSRSRLIQPTVLIGHPREISPLARANDDNPAIVDRFQVVVCGSEIVNAYSELVDPVDQRQRLEEQARQRAAGDEEAMPLDEDYLEAMEYGMPPISGFGMGIDRFVALLTGQDNIRSAVLFPLMRLESQEAAGEPS
jgi:lysyl-tRNA synthetase class 2